MTKVFYITDARFPTEKAHGIQIAKTCEQFILQGVNLTLVIPNRSQTENLKNKSEKELYGLSVKIPTARLFTVDLLVLFRKFPELLKNFLYFLLIGTYSVSLLFYVLKNSKKDDIIYSRELFILLPLMLFTRRKIFYEIHNVSSTAFGKMLSNFCIKHLKGLVAISEGVYEDFVGKRKIAHVIARDGVDFELFNKAEPIKLGFEKPVFLYTGNIYAWKGVDTILEAAKIWQSKKLNGTFVIIGGDEVDQEIPKLQKKVEAMELKNLVHMPYQDHKKIPAYLKAADVLLLPNTKKKVISSKYTSPLKLFEYLASGKAILASNIDSLKEVLNDENAYFFEADNASDMVKKLENIKSSEKSKTAIQTAKKYSWENRVKLIRDFILK